MADYFINYIESKGRMSKSRRGELIRRSVVLITEEEQVAWSSSQWTNKLSIYDLLWFTNDMLFLHLRIFIIKCFF